MSSHAFPRVGQYEAKLQSLARSRRDVSSQGQQHQRSVCPPDNITLDNGALISVKRDELAKGSESSLWLFGTEQGEEYVVKVLSRDCGELISGALDNEKAVLSVIGDVVDGVVKMFDVDVKKTQIFPSCLTRILVTERLDKGLNVLLDPLSRDKAFLASIIQQGFDILKSLHETGFVHGDIHSANWMLDGAGKLRLIDFGFAAPYVDAHGTHVQELVRIRPPSTLRTPSFNEGLVGLIQDKIMFPFRDKLKLSRESSSSPSVVTREPNLLAPWHLESGNIEAYRLSRRDDLFRFAEMLYEIHSIAYRANLEGAKAEASVIENVATRAAHWAKFKREIVKSAKVDNDGFPDVFLSFYRSMLELHFEEEPPYLFWKDIFIQALNHH